MKATTRMGLCAWILWAGAALAKPDEPPAEPDNPTGVGTESPRGHWPVDPKGPYFLLGGGASGYTGQLNDMVYPGVAYGVAVGYKPVPAFGVELAYNGGVNELHTGFGAKEPIPGADIVRNCGQVAATLDITRTRLHPYVTAGLGFERFGVRATLPTGLTSDLHGYVPAGLGLRYQVGPIFTADARMTWNAPFAQDLGPIPTERFGDGRYQALVQLGATY